MTGTALEERLLADLSRRAGAVSAPPTGAVRRRVDDQASVLRRRRHARRAAAGVAMVATLLATGLWLRTDDRERTAASPPALPSSGPPHHGAWHEPPPGGGPLPGFRIEGFTTIWTGDASSPDQPAETVDSSDPPSSWQVFREPGNSSGPVVGVASFGDCGMCDGIPPTLPSPELATDVVVGGRAVRLWSLDPDGRVLHWRLPGGRQVFLGARDLMTPEVLAFAEGLRPRVDGLGVQATVLPQGMVEQAPPGAGSSSEAHVHDTESRDVVAAIRVMRGGSKLVDALTGPFDFRADYLQHVTVLGRPAALLHRAAGARLGGGSADGWDAWTLTWRHTSDVVVEVTVHARDAAAAAAGGPADRLPDRETIDQVIAGLREIESTVDR